VRRPRIDRHLPSDRAARRAAGLAAGVAAALLLGACGDDGASPAASGSGAPAGLPAAGDPTAVTCVAGGSMGGAGTGETSTDVEISGFTFRPGGVEIDAGSSITFTNLDGADHSVWSAVRVDGSPSWLSVGSDPELRLPELLHEGDASTCTFAGPGTYEYLCGVHNSMTATVVVR
jgi:plastocyanin